jgi:hypothetical protein
VPRTVSTATRSSPAARRRRQDGPHRARGLGARRLGAQGSGRTRRIQVVSVVLGARARPTRNEDTLELLEWGVRRFRVSSPVTEGRQFASVPIRHRRGARLPLVAVATCAGSWPAGSGLRVRIAGMPVRSGRPGAARPALRHRRGLRGIAAHRSRAAGGVRRGAGSRRDASGEVLADAAAHGRRALLALACSVSLARMGFRRRDRRSRPRREEPGVVA